MASTTPPPGPHFTQQTTSPPTISPQANDTEGQAEDETEMPITMAASVVLDHLPRDAHEALSQAGKLTQDKSIVCSIFVLVAMVSSQSIFFALQAARFITPVF